MQAFNPRRSPPRTFPTIMAMMMLENGSPKKSDPSAKSAMVRLAPNHSVKVLKGMPCLFSSPTCSIPSFSKAASRFGQADSIARMLDGRPRSTVARMFGCLIKRTGRTGSGYAGLRRVSPSA